jgi:hypothetical protein
MKKSDLKTGMWVKTKDYLWMVVLIENEPFLIYPDGWMPVENFPQICGCDNTFDALEVYKYKFESEVAGALQYKVWKNKLETSGHFTKIWSTPPKETIKIGEITYDKAKFEEAVKNLKPIK